MDPLGLQGLLKSLLHDLCRPQNVPANDLERFSCMVIMMTGTLVVTGLASATMAIVLSIYLKHEEAFRARFKLIMRDMVSNCLLISNVSKTIEINKSDNRIVNSR